MKRIIAKILVISMLALALAGCAQTPQKELEGQLDRLKQAKSYDWEVETRTEGVTAALEGLIAETDVYGADTTNGPGEYALRGSVRDQGGANEAQRVQSDDLTAVVSMENAYISASSLGIFEEDDRWLAQDMESLENVCKQTGELLESYILLTEKFNLAGDEIATREVEGQGRTYEFTIPQKDADYETKFSVTCNNPIYTFEHGVSNNAASVYTVVTFDMSADYGIMPDPEKCVNSLEDLFEALPEVPNNP